MAKPAKPKNLKPKAEGSPAAKAGGGAAQSPGGGAMDLKTIILIVAMLVSSVAGSALTAFVLGPMVMVPAITDQLSHMTLTAGGEAHGEQHEEGHGKRPKIGMNLELDEFRANLKHDPTVKGNQFLAAKMSLSVLVPDEQNCNLMTHGHGDSGGGHGDSGPSPEEACQLEFNKAMGRYVPTVRDIINSALMKRTAGQLSTLEGQEALKDDIIQEINHLIIDDGYRILRVNMQDFIVQR